VRLDILERGDVPLFEPGLADQLDKSRREGSITFHSSVSDALDGAAEWGEFTEINFDDVATKMKGRLMVDARNVLEPDAVLRSGFTYVGVGRSIAPISSPRRSLSDPDAC